MRDVSVEKRGDEIVIMIGTVDQSGKYEVLKIKPEEAAVLMMLLKQKL